MRRPLAATMLLLALVVPLASCGDTDPSAREPSDQPSTTTTPSTVPCDPGGGHPVAKAGCPDPAPVTAWLDVEPDGGLVLHPFRTLGNDDEGRAYAQSHHLEFPFPDDYYDAPSGPPSTLDLDAETVCTGIIRVGYREPLADHAVDCGSLVDAAAQLRLTVAVWRDVDTVVQVSELYRP
jgi:hypothetical protein